MKLGVKLLHPDSVIPTKANPNDVGFDMYAVSVEFEIFTNRIPYLTVKCYTGIAIDLPPGFAGILYARSSLTKTPFQLHNGVGIVDPGYYDEIQFRFIAIPDLDISSNRIESRNMMLSWAKDFFKKGDRVGQLVVHRVPEIELYDVLDAPFSAAPNRGGGFGSTGKHNT